MKIRPLKPKRFFNKAGSLVAIRPLLKKDPCVYCYRRKKMSLEHVLPKSMGGNGALSNLVGACKTCNMKRGSTGLLLYLLERMKQ
jgi:5-methylcytosine-specific restriction endonuclease McrA